MGNAAAMRKSADELDKIKLGIISAYRNKTGLDILRYQLHERGNLLHSARRRGKGLRR